MKATFRGAQSVCLLVIASLSGVAFGQSATQVAPAPPSGAGAANPPGAFQFTLRHDTLEEREEMLRRAQADTQRKVPMEVAPLAAQKIDPSAIQRR